ncbi:TetR/AcrR family transcriptional regulator [Actinoplanes sp. GCM10030250]|uniref:TetR/AcrR family transcriptional regulator n=1 Tax=Actinoplanes sp. GCM10030250 TaxID=3273376 RepID=UPI00361DE397
MTRTRLTAQERHVQLVAAAVKVFAEGGYAGSTTDQVARLAGVSQPYVVRLFGTKQELFLATLRYAGDRIEEKWRAAAGAEPTLGSLGHAYKDLLAERELLAVLLHGYAAAGDPVIGDAVRECYGRLYTVVRDLTGAEPAEVRDFFAMGMLITVLGSMRVLGSDPVPLPPWAVELLQTMPEG